MAYYAPFYRPTYYDQMQNPNMGQFNQQFQQPMAQPMAQPTPQPQVNNGLFWVQGEAAAKSYPVAPNCTVMLLDSEISSFYLKSADSSGMPLPLRIFDYKERINAPSQAAVAPTSEEKVNLDDFVTRKEFEDRMASIGSGCKCKEHGKNKLMEDADNGEQSV